MHTDIAIVEPADIVLVSDLGANHKLLVSSLTVLTKKGGFPAYDFDGPAGVANLGLQRGDRVRVLSGGANNNNRVLAIKSVTASNVTLEDVDALLAGDGAVEFDFEFIRRRE